MCALIIGIVVCTFAIGSTFHLGLGESFLAGTVAFLLFILSPTILNSFRMQLVSFTGNLYTYRYPNGEMWEYNKSTDTWTKLPYTYRDYKNNRSE